MFFFIIGLFHGGERVAPSFSKAVVYTAPKINLDRIVIVSRLAQTGSDEDT